MGTSISRMWMKGWADGRARVSLSLLSLLILSCSLVNPALDHVRHVLLAPLLHLEVPIRSERLRRGPTPRPHPHRLHLLRH